MLAPQTIGGQMKIALAADHGGYRLKEYIKRRLKERGADILDLGAYSEEPTDYPIYGKLCGDAVSNGDADKGIVFCGSGIGISIAANKVKGIRCALCTSVRMAQFAKRHNDANVLALGERILEEEEAAKIVDSWLDAEFEGGRHQSRVDILNSI
jgi:ribose 5-phosphate isomerase B